MGLPSGKEKKTVAAGKAPNSPWRLLGNHPKCLRFVNHLVEAQLNNSTQLVTKSINYSNPQKDRNTKSYSNSDKSHGELLYLLYVILSIISPALHLQLEISGSGIANFGCRVVSCGAVDFLGFLQIFLVILCAFNCSRNRWRLDEDFIEIPDTVNVYKKLMGKIQHAING